MFKVVPPFLSPRNLSRYGFPNRSGIREQVSFAFSEMYSTPKAPKHAAAVGSYHLEWPKNGSSSELEEQSGGGPPGLILGLGLFSMGSPDIDPSAVIVVTIVHAATAALTLPANVVTVLLVLRSVPVNVNR